MGQEHFLAGLSFTWKRYQASSGNWDHEHCEFCNKKFLDAHYAAWMRETLMHPSDDHVGAGYSNLRRGDTPSGRHWVCRECFSDFGAEFGWTVVQSDSEAWPYDTPEPRPRPTAGDFDPEARSQSV